MRRVQVRVNARQGIVPVAIVRQPPDCHHVVWVRYQVLVAIVEVRRSILVLVAITCGQVPLHAVQLLVV